MGALILSSRFMRQPQQAAPIDRANPLANGLVHCWGLDVVGSRQFLDSSGSANGVFGQGNGGTTGNSWQPGSNGYFVNFNDGGTGSVTSVALAVGDVNGTGSPGSSTFTFLKRMRLSTLANQPGTGTALALYATGPAGSTGGIEIRVDSGTGRIQLLRQALELIAESTSSVPVGIDSDIGVSYDSSTVRFYINGVPAGVTSAASKTFALARQYYLGYADLAAAERLPNDSRIYIASVWNRALSPSEFTLWGQNPWQLFKAQSRKLYVTSAGGAANTSVSPSNGALSITGFVPNVTSTANQSVVPASGSIALTGFAPAVIRTANQSASPSVGAIGISGYAPTISQAINLSVTPASGAISISGYSPTVVRTLATVVLPVSVSLTIAGYAPVVSRTSSSSVSPGLGQVSVAGYAPTVMQTAPIITVKYHFVLLRRDYNTDTIHFSG